MTHVVFAGLHYSLSVNSYTRMLTILNSQVFLQIFTTRNGRKVPATIVFS